MNQRLPSFYRFAPIVMFLAVTAVNFGVQDDRRFEDDGDTLVTAAGYAFSIWGVIFLGMIGFSVVLAKAHEPDTPYLRRAIIGLLVAGIASVAFVPISIQGNQIFGFLDVALHLVALIYAYGNLRQHVAITPTQPRKQRFWFYGPSMYLGWISAATVIASSLALNQLGFNPSIEVSVILAIVLVVVLLAIGLTFQAKADNVYGLTVAWALIAVGVEQADTTSISYIAFAGAAILVINAIVRQVQHKYGFYATPGYTTHTSSV